MKQIPKWIAPVIIGLIIIAGSIYATARTHYAWQGRQFFGQVTQYSDNRLTIQDSRGRQISFTIDPHAEIIKGKKTLSRPLVIGDQVLVSSPRIITGIPEAILIRVVDIENERIKNMGQPSN